MNVFVTLPFAALLVATATAFFDSHGSGKPPAPPAPTVTSLDLGHPELVDGKYHDYDHLGLRVGTFRPSYNVKVTKVTFDSQGIWTAKDDGVQHLLELVVFYKCMGIGLAHVTFYAGFNDKRTVFLGYSHDGTDMAVVTEEAFYKKLLHYTKPDQPRHPELPAHDVFFKLNKLLKGEEKLADTEVKKEEHVETASDEL